MGKEVLEKIDWYHSIIINEIGSLKCFNCLTGRGLENADHHRFLVEIVNDLLQMCNQRKLGANLFSILSADKLETVFNGIFASANSIHIEQRMQRGEQMEGVQP